MHRPAYLPCIIAAVTCPLGGAALAQDLIFAPGSGPFSWASYEDFAANNDFTGEELIILGASTGDDKTKQENLFAYFEAATGADIRYSGSESFEQDIVIAVQAGTPPHISMFPQPGLAKDLAARGALTALPDDTSAWFSDNFAAGESWASLASFPGEDGTDRTYGMFFGTDVKSLIWYSPDAFDEAGYDIPQSMEELKLLTEQIVSDGGTPWCIGLGSGAATGWPATDWVEDMMLRTQSPETYDAWVAGDLPFDDPAVTGAIEEYGWFAREDAFVAGGQNAVATTDFRDSVDGLFSFPPECYMHKQASFIPTFFPDNVELGLDADFFYFPAYESKDLGRPILGSGGLAAITADTPVAQAFIEFLKTPFAHEIAIAQGQFLTPHLAATPEAYQTDVQRALGEILTQATTFRFDGSDLMPGEVGTDAFWTGMVDYTTGSDADTVAERIRARWESIQ